jgi:hypothetical protein
VTCNVTPSLQVNPAVYFTNDGNHRPFGYIVMSYTLPLWAEKK